MTSNPPPAPRPPTSIHPEAVIADKAVLSGANLITIAENVIIHPYARLDSSGGAVTIGANTIVYENAKVGCAMAGAVEIKGGWHVGVGSGCTIEGNAVVEGQIGDGTEVGVGASVGQGAKVGRHCKIAAIERVEPGEELEDFTVIFGDGKRRMDKTMRDNTAVMDAKSKGQDMAIELMKRMVGNTASKWV